MLRILLPLAALMLLASVSFQATVPQGAPVQSDPVYDRLPAGAGREVTIKACVTCHDPQRAASVRLTREGWYDVIASMVSRGMKSTPEEQEQIVEYLSTHFLGEAPRPININTAEQLDFEMVMGLLRREAALVIAHRDLNGPFKEITELKKVKGLDYKKVEKSLDRIVAFVPGTR